LSYIIRNSVALGVVLVIILAVGVFVTTFQLPKKSKALEIEIKKIEVDIQNTPDLANQYNVAVAQLEDSKRRWETRNKDVPSKDITGETYGYFNRIIDISGEVKLDLAYVGPRDFGRYGYNVYSFKGESSFDNLYKFIWNTENGRRLFKISNLTLRGYESKSKETGETKVLTLFDMEVQAYYSSIPELNTAPAQRDLAQVTLTTNPFFPLIFREIPPPQKDEIEIERSILSAVIPGKAFIVDQNQKPRTLEVGDRIYLGYVTRIIPDLGKVECLLNKGGVSERYEMTIRLGQSLK